MLHAEQVDDKLEITAKRCEPQFFLERLVNCRPTIRRGPISVLVSARIELRENGYVVLTIRHFDKS